MSYFPIIVLAVVAFLIAAFVLKLEKRGWTLFAAVLVFGLAGYATQGAPEMAGAPKEAAETNARESGEAMVAARRGLFDSNATLTPYLTMSDGQARAGQFADAAGMLRKGLADNPGHAEAWLALGNALVEHAEGQLTPAALYAYGKADAAAPGHPGTSYFLGVALLRSGRPGEARGVWADMLAKSPEDAPWREDLQIRIERLDAMLAQSGIQAPPTQTEASQATE
ncbi:MAG: tetratricopeptide repeat protein [Erythrobacter sp.]